MSSRHTSDGGRRGIAPWIVVTLVSALVVAGAVVAYVLIVDGDDAAASNCTSDVVLEVVASPGSAAAITAAAAAFDATRPVARSACVSTAVTTLAGPAAGRALADGWTAESSPVPAVWVPDSEADLLTLEAADGSLTAGRNPHPLALSPVVLAVRSEDAGAVNGAALSWQGLPKAVGPHGTVRLPGDGKLIVALPDPSNNRATSYALQSVVAAGTDKPVDGAAVKAAAPKLVQVGAGGPHPEPALTQDALGALAAGSGGFTAVPVVQSELTAFTADTSGLTAVSPSGPTAGDALFAVALTASWVTPTLDDAAAAFTAYLRGAGGRAAFTAEGLDVVEPAAPTSNATSSGPATVKAASAAAEPPTGSGQGRLPDGGPEVAAALAAALGKTPSG